jgi:isochorismate hydrolase
MKNAYLNEHNLPQKTDQWMTRIKQLVPSYRRGKLVMSQAALLLIDLQRFFTSPDSHAFVPSSEAIISSCQRLAEYFHAQHRPVIHTWYAMNEGEVPLMERFWKHVLRPEEPVAALDVRIPRRKTDLIIRKPSYATFNSPDGPRLLDYLGRHQCNQILIAGLMTHLCVDMAAREAFLSSFEPFIVADATASIAEELHLTTLISAAHGYAHVTRVADIQ